MSKMTLMRVAYTPSGVFGVLKFKGWPFAVTLEDRWKNNEVGVSCIPSGTYLATRCNRSIEYNKQNSPKFGDTFVIEDVPGRSHILFHKGNTSKDTSGCILIGEQFGIIGGQRAILSSKAGFDEFMRITKNRDSFILTIENG